MALDSAASDAANNGKMFVPQNWVKNKGCLIDLRSSIRQYLNALRMIPGGKDVIARLNTGFAMNKENFEVRWTAD